MTPINNPSYGFLEGNPQDRSISHFLSVFHQQVICPKKPPGMSLGCAALLDGLRKLQEVRGLIEVKRSSPKELASGDAGNETWNDWGFPSRKP